VVKVDPLLSDTEVAEDLPLNSEILFLGRASRVPDEDAGRRPGRPVPDRACPQLHATSLDLGCV
jgi:hypothetical protein